MQGDAGRCKMMEGDAMRCEVTKGEALTWSLGDRPLLGVEH